VAVILIVAGGGGAGGVVHVLKLGHAGGHVDVPAVGFDALLRLIAGAGLRLPIDHRLHVPRLVAEHLLALARVDDGGRHDDHAGSFCGAPVAAGGVGAGRPSGDTRYVFAVLLIWTVRFWSC
jgi:hypothetical protein